MENAGNTVQNNIRTNKKVWSPEEKLAIVQDWTQRGLSLAETCRKHGVHALTVHRWKNALERGLQNRSDLIPKSQVITLQKKVDELERALGRKALEVDILKKTFELKGLKLPEGM